ncbi:MAG TPA: methyltransferase [Burkholderiales bacterium]|nr:methyltransferase [Burkholderiales bacterium]
MNRLCNAAGRKLARRLAAGVCLLAVMGGCTHQPASSDSALIDRAIAGGHRSMADRARDIYRHPRETLLFFGLRPEMTVVEIWPGAGWYTEILAPVLRERGRYYAAHFHVDEKSPRYMGPSRQNFEKRLADRAEIYDKTTVTAFSAPQQTAIAPRGTVDLVLTFRNVHNWTAARNDEASFRAFYEALKPGGVLGVVEHRAQEGAPLEQMIKTGYMTEAYVIALAERAGFRLVARSEINANPGDTRDHPRGVWTLPPTFRLGDQDRAKYAAIGESDRMTLKFIKPTSP